MILEIDEERRRLSLGMKQCQPNPWDEFANNHSKGEKIMGKIKSITDFGIFIPLFFCLFFADTKITLGAILVFFLSKFLFFSKIQEK